MCSPVAHASQSFGDDFWSEETKWKSWKLAFPAPPPPPLLNEPLFETPQLKERISISPGCFLSRLSPGMPSSFRNASNAIGHPAIWVRRSWNSAVLPVCRRNVRAAHAVIAAVPPDDGVHIVEPARSDTEDRAVGELEPLHRDRRAGARHDGRREVADLAALRVVERPVRSLHRVRRRKLAGLGRRVVPAHVRRR